MRILLYYFIIFFEAWFRAGEKDLQCVKIREINILIK